MFEFLGFKHDIHISPNTLYACNMSKDRYVAVSLLTDLNTDSLLPIYGLSGNKVLRDQSVLLPTSYEHT